MHAPPFAWQTPAMEAQESPSSFAPPSTGSVVAVGAIAALIGSVAWGLVRYYANVEHGIVAWGIGGLVGFAMIWRKASTTPQAMAAGALALASIVCGKYTAFQLAIGEVAEQNVAQIDENAVEETRKNAAAWVALGASPTDEQVREFAKQYDFEFGTTAEFRAGTGQFLSWVDASKPDVAAFRARLRADMLAQISFVDYLKEDFHVLDVLFAFLGVSTAFGMVKKAEQARMAAIAAASEPQPESPAS